MGGPQTLTVFAAPSNGFSGNVLVTVNLASLPTGVLVSPGSLTLAPGALGTIAIHANYNATGGTGAIQLSGKSGAITASASVPLTVAPPMTSASLSANWFDFGDNLVRNTVTKAVVTVSNTGTNNLTLAPALTGDPGYSLSTGGSGVCGTTLHYGLTCHVIVNYTPTTASAPASQTATLNLHFGNVPPDTPATVTLTGVSGAVAPGVVTPTGSPLVAQYTLNLPFPGSMKVNFGTSTGYGFETWSQSTDTAGPLSILVAGMHPLTTYDMAATVTFANGMTWTDANQTFKTADIPTPFKLGIVGDTTAGMSPEPGIEFLNPLVGLEMTDLRGDPIWTYQAPVSPGSSVQGAHQLPNGNILVNIGLLNNAPLNGPISPDSIIEVREINLAGDTVKEITVDDLNVELANSTCQECNVTLTTFHHDVLPLPNGHWIVLGSTIRALSATTNPPLTNEPAQNVAGDAIVDLDQNLQPVWAWNEFNHLDPNRHPYAFPDWTHSNAIIYSPDDGDVIMSIRHQNWVIKINYANGAGDGSIVWHLGEGGDFKLVGGVDPTDWIWAQHGPDFFSPNTSGVFSLGLFDNGDDRQFAAGVTCGATGNPPCLYSTVPIFQIDEKGKTATITFHDILPAPSEYSYFGGDVRSMANGNVELDICGESPGSEILEVTRTATPQLVWRMRVEDTNFYRGFRIGSPYPGVTWAADTGATEVPRK
jgi:hypothetical protein